ncbi:hypothetical protein H4R34_005838, partial [Dimargaris verticillata]
MIHPFPRLATANWWEIAASEGDPWPFEPTPPDTHATGAKPGQSSVDIAITDAGSPGYPLALSQPSSTGLPYWETHTSDSADQQSDLLVQVTELLDSQMIVVAGQLAASLALQCTHTPTKDDGAVASGVTAGKSFQTSSRAIVFNHVHQTRLY